MDDNVELLLGGQILKKFQEAYYSAILEKYALSLIDVRVLLFLAENVQHDTARDIVENHRVAKSYVSKSIEKLIEKGFLCRKNLPDDRRYVHLAVREEAFPVIEAVREQRCKMFSRIFQGVSQEQLATLKEVAKKVNTNITEMEGTI